MFIEILLPIRLLVSDICCLMSCIYNILTLSAFGIECQIYIINNNSYYLLTVDRAKNVCRIDRYKASS